jgi:capsular polysaccharide biosynthesis protein
VNLKSNLLFVCEKYFLRFYRPVADRLARAGYRPVWIALDGPDRWDHDTLDPSSAIDELIASGVQSDADVNSICRFERLVFDRPDLFQANYAYTINVVRTLDRAPRLADAWYLATLALVARFEPSGVFVWNGRYLPYSAVSAACQSAGQLLLTSEIGWIPGTIFLDCGSLSADTTDLLGRSFESTEVDNGDRADAFLREYRAQRATMVSQPEASPEVVRQQLLADGGSFLLLYGCQVDWDTNVVIGARRFSSNESAVSFLMDALSGIPGARIVVKTHPLDSKMNDARLRQIVGERGRVVSDIHPHVLIEAADCVAVRNSTLGFEALCYEKPLIALEPAKYKHPQLTLDARSVEEARAGLLTVSNNECALPDRSSLRRFVLHLLDHYLVPAQYEYFFEPAKLELLSHFGRSDSFTSLEQRLRHAPTRVSADSPAVQAVARCRLMPPPRESSLLKQARRLAGWFRC